MNPPRLDNRTTEGRKRWPLSEGVLAQLVAVGAVLATYVLKLGINQVLPQERSPYLIFPAVIMLSAAYGGWRAGLTATVLSAIFSLKFLTASLATPAAWFSISLFVIEGGIICALAEALHRSRIVIRRQEMDAAEAKIAASEHDQSMRSIREQLTTREVMLRHLIDANVLGFIACRLDGQIVEANDAFLKMIEATPEDLAEGRVNWRTLTPPDYRELDDRLIENLRTHGRFEAAEKEYCLPSGRRVPIWVAGAFTPSRDQVMCFVVDRTIQKQAESALVKAKEAAERSNQTRGEFVANVSHELRTPMNAILGMTELALDEKLPSQARDYLETSYEASRTLLSLLDDVLDFSRIDAEKLELESAAFSIREVVDQVMRITGMRAGEKGLELASSVARGVPDQVLGDKGRFRQILLNLVGNAIKFTHEGEVFVEVSCHSPVPDGTQATSPQTRLKVVVKDTGIGISVEDQARIFEPFTQVDTSPTREYGGAGLGLAIVHQLVEAMGGEISVQSELQRGSQFTVQLLFPVVGTSSSQCFSEGDVHSRLLGTRVLVVDDSQTNRRVLLEMISSWLMEATLAADATEALKALQTAQAESRPFDFVLVDAAMPSTDGVSLLRQAEQQGLLHGAAILMVSSHDQKNIGELPQELPIRGLLRKPVSQSELFDLLVESIEGPIVEKPSFESLSDLKLGLRILVAEDAPANQKVVKAILEKRGHHVTLASNGKEAVNLVRDSNFDVVLMDVQMPIMDGLVATRIIRQLPTHSHVPIIAMTAHAMRGDRERCLEAGMNDYISKPIESHLLIRRVEQGLTNATRSSLETADKVVPAPSIHTAATEETPVSDSMIDRKGALDRLGGDLQLLKEMAAFFVQDSPELLETIQREKVGEEATRAAHSLRGLASNFGAEQIMESAMRLESTATSAEGRERALAQLEADLPKLIDELQQLASEP